MAKLEIKIDVEELGHILASLQCRLGSDLFEEADGRLRNAVETLTIKIHGALEDYNFSLKEEAE